MDKNNKKFTLDSGDSNKDASFGVSEMNDVTKTSGTIPAEAITNQQPTLAIPEVNLASTAPVANQVLAEAGSQVSSQTELQKLTDQRIADVNKQRAEQTSLIAAIGDQGGKLQEAFVQGEQSLKPIEDEIINLTALINSKSQAINNQLIDEAGRRIPQAFITGRQAIIQQRGTAELSALSGLLDAKNGQMQLAQGKIDRALDIFREVSSAELAEKQARVSLLKEISGESRDAEDTEIARLKEEQEKFEMERKEISSIAMQAMQAGAGSNEIAAITGAKTRDQAIAAAKSLGKMARINMAIKSVQLSQARTKLSAAANAGKISPAEGSNLGSQIEQVKSIMNPKKVGGKSVLSRIIGATPIGGIVNKVSSKIGGGKTITDKVIGQSRAELKIQRGLFPVEENDYISSVENVLNGLTLNTFAEAKEKGMTFGAMSQGEWDILSNSATSLTQRRIKSSNRENAKVIGYSGSEEAFMNDMNNIQNSISSRYASVTGETYQSDKFEVDESGNIVLPGEALDNSSYFNQ